MSEQEHRSLRLAIIEYLNGVAKDGSLSADATESLEVAVQCLMEAFGIESMDKCTEENAIKPLTLPVVFHTGVQVLMGSESNDAAKNVPEDSQQGRQAERPAEHDEGQEALFKKFIVTLKERGFFAGLEEGTPEWDERMGRARAKFSERYSASSMAPAGKKSQEPAAAVEPLRERLQEETKRMEEAEAEKVKGNDHLTNQRYAEAVRAYSSAIQLWPNNAVYYSNRAAAYTHMHMYDEAINDCRKAIKIKPDFAKAYSDSDSLLTVGRYKEALDEGYLTAAELEPSNQQYAKAIDLARSRLNEASNRAFPQGAGAAGGFDIDEALLGGAGGLFSNPELLQTLSALQGGCPGGFPNANSAGAMGNEGDGNAFLSQSAEAFQAALASPGFEDLRSSAKAQKIVSDLRQYGPMAFMNYVNDDEATDIINRLSSAALTHLGPPGYS
ncbi:hypothetical protein GUITHDRAFT_115401 [Guillardia theta CCMP2712]|uniref:SGTA homodimerisation domain-containing protein n=1 Tax=Guillardia theta (strain CCMP2712) TaxID=905079 RepID=L1IQB0_GUITC|nr:hypothetical protein GUITHDRAFT_115401 [Guillardia theta CCMP2712]EKX38433.1 hypothetical protein GUITHDRAFT_115401 [Guillardia theta CCMP2712]|eukprot:XP_005825413.1 hypothetical protein GUITHDRAFT_115401 [Guillardia theta CCMP2712]